MSTTPADGPAVSLQERSDGAGFTLLEVMVAVTVIAFAFVGLLGLQARNLQSVAYSQQLTRATLLAQMIIAKIQVDVATGGFAKLNDGGGRRDDYPEFRYEIEVLSTPFDQLREVLVRVIWDERDPRGCELLFFVRDPSV
jgi:prepilin-type N-terminal cleavage/methylation domain-containing protein